MEGVGTEARGVACVCVRGTPIAGLDRFIHLDFSSQFTRLRQIIRAELVDAFALQRPAFADAAGGGFPGPERAARRQLAWRSRELATALGTRDRDETRREFFQLKDARSIVRRRSGETYTSDRSNAHGYISTDDGGARVDAASCHAARW